MNTEKVLLRRVGNSLVLTLPVTAASQLQWQAGDELLLRVQALVAGNGVLTVRRDGQARQARRQRQVKR